MDVIALASACEHNTEAVRKSRAAFSAATFSVEPGGGGTLPGGKFCGGGTFCGGDILVRYVPRADILRRGALRGSRYAADTQWISLSNDFGSPLLFGSQLMCLILPGGGRGCSLLRQSLHAPVR